MKIKKNNGKQLYPWGTPDVDVKWSVLEQLINFY